MLNSDHRQVTAKELLAEMLDLRNEVCREGEAIFALWRPLIVRRAFYSSAVNLSQYIALRRRDIRPLQTALMPWGLSSLGRSEARVLPNLDAVIATLGAICGEDVASWPHPPLRAFFRGERRLAHNADEVLGPRPVHRRVRIMVTLPTEAAEDKRYVEKLLARGMNLARINCAHDSSDEWQAMIRHIRKAEATTGHRCRIHMDVAGPKVRTDAVLTPDPKQRLHVGDCFLLARHELQPEERFPLQVTCTLPAVFDHLRPGAAVWIDDGRMGCTVEKLLPEGALLLVTSARPKGERLRPDKGLNFPDTRLPLSPLTARDYAALDFAVAHADTVGYSFVQEPADIDHLLSELQARENRSHHPGVGIVAKIETARAIENLPELIVHAAGRRAFAVMLARGDLAVEIGYQRMAEMQEEILWLCEAAHIPIIWATQVLENLTQKGIPSRAEISDAAMSERAECVMLNKGPYIREAVSMLDDVLVRMQAHQSKKTSQLRALRSW
jgi:pyruvate kinase